MVNIREELEVYDLYYQPMCSLTDATLESAKNIRENHSINTISRLTFDIPLSSEKIQYIRNESLVKYKGEFYKMRIPKYSHSEDGTLSMTVDCVHLSASLEGIENDFLEEIGKSPTDLLKAVLGYPRNEDGSFIVGASTTGWKVGRVTVDNNKFRSLTVQETSVFSNLVSVAELYAGLLIFHSDTLTVDLVDDPVDRVAYPNRNIEIRHGKNLKTLDVQYDSSDLVTELAVFGGEAEDGSGAIHIMEHNPTGMSFLEDYSYYEEQGYDRAYIDQHPELFYKRSVWDAQEYVDSLALYEDAVAKMQIISRPKVSASVSMADFSMFPEYFLENPIMGEYVDIIDEDLGVSIRARVTSVDQNSDNMEDFGVQISNEVEYESIVRTLMTSSDRIMKNTTPSGDTKARSISGIIEIEKANLYSTQSHWYTDPNDGGLIFENPEKTKALKLGAGVFGIASNKVNGQYNFTAFGTGDGFTANQIITGILQGSKVRWDLDNATFLIGNSTTDYLMYFDGTKLHMNAEISYAQLDDATKQHLSDGVSAKALVTDISSDSKITPSEKITLLREWNNIVSEKVELVATADTYALSVQKSAYITAFDALAKFLNNNMAWTTGTPSLLANTTTTSTIVGSTMQSVFATYFQKRDSLSNSIYVTARTLANNAQGTANTATTNISNMSLDSKLTPVEKILLKQEWEAIVKEQPVIIAQLDVYANTAEKSALNTAYSDLNNYVPPLLINMTTTTDVVGATLRGYFSSYYEKRAMAYKAITDGAKGLITTAQSTANTAVTNAQTAQTTANNAVSSATTANNLISDIANDNKITPTEKSSTLLQWETILSEKSIIEAQAVSYAIVTEKNTYNTSFTNLANYLNNNVTWSTGVPAMLSNLTTTTNIVGTTFRSTFKAYYDARTTLLKVIAEKAKTLADTAQSTAVGAQNTADTAVANASTAKATADSAVTSATTANNLLSNIASDSKLTPSEKASTLKEWNIIASEKATIDAQALSYGVSSTSYGTAFTTLANYLNGGTAWTTGVPSMLSNLTTTTDIVGATFRANFKGYYDARTALLKAVADKAKLLADNAQSSANSAQTTANTAITNAQTAQNTANTAVTNAGTANSLLADISSDSKITPSEKASTLKEWSIIESERATIVAQALAYTVSSTTYSNAFTALANYLHGATWSSGVPAMLSNLTTTNTIVGSTFRSTFKTYYDAKTSLLRAIAEKAKDLADSAQASANTAQTTANDAVSKANNAQGLINDMASDSKMTAVEKKSLYSEWESVKKEKIQIEAQLTVYALATTTFINAYNSLSSIVSPLLTNMAVTSDVSATTLGNAMAVYYDQRALAYKAITDKAKTLADTAQTKANEAHTNAGTAQTTANTAVTNAGTANNAISDISSDSKLTPVEKISVKLQWDTIIGEKDNVIAQGTKYGIATTTYANAFQSLANYLNGGAVWSTGTPSWINTLTTTTDIVGTTFRTNFKTYYDAKTALLKAVADKAKDLADGAQITANTANGTANTAKGTADTALANANNAKAKTDAWTYAGTTEINGTSIRTGTMTFEKAKGGTLTLGGSGTNGGANGVLSLKNASDVEIIKMNQDGITLSNGAKLVSDGGVISMFVWNSAGLYTGGFAQCGYWEGSSGFKNISTVLEGSIPSNLTITSATLIVSIASRYCNPWKNWDTGATVTGYRSVKNVRVRKSVTASNAYFLIDDNNYKAEMVYDAVSPTDITAGTVGTWSPTAGTTIQSKSVSVLTHVVSGGTFRFFIDSGNVDATINNGGLCMAQLQVTGYFK